MPTASPVRTAFVTGISLSSNTSQNARHQHRLAHSRPRWAARAVQEAPRRTVPRLPVLPELSVGAAPAGRPAKRRRKAQDFAVEGDFLESTAVHRVKVYGFFGLVCAALAQSLGGVTGLPSLAGVGAGVVCGWLFADLGTGVYHWAVDNYGGPGTPVLGGQIAAFQGHHRAPQTIAAREFANNLHQLTVPTAPQVALLLLAHPPPALEAFAASALALIVLSQEFHRQAHSPCPTPLARALQRAGVCLPKAMHARHHTEPFDGNYCIVSGVCNGPLDRAKVFRRLEAAVFRATGTEPVAWKLDPRLKEESLKL